MYWMAPQMTCTMTHYPFVLHVINQIDLLRHRSTKLRPHKSNHPQLKHVETSITTTALVLLLSTNQRRIRLCYIAGSLWLCARWKKNVKERILFEVNNRLRAKPKRRTCSAHTAAQKKNRCTINSNSFHISHQPAVSLDTTEYDIMCLTKSLKEVKLLRKLFKPLANRNRRKHNEKICFVLQSGFYKT